MSEQELITDLAIAERNVKTKIKYQDVSYAEEVRCAFQKHDVRSYFDLIQCDVRQALELRKLAIHEHLL